MGSRAHQARILQVLAGTEFKLKYADSVLGYVWSFLKPLAMFSVLYVIFGRFFKVQSGFPHFALYLLIGIVLFTYLTDATSTALPSIVSRGTLMRKLSFPRLIVPVSAVATSTITFSVNLFVVAVFVAANRLVPRLEWLFVLPLLVELIVFVTGLSLLLATLFVRFRDIGQLWELVIQLLFYSTPIFYPINFLPSWVQKVEFANPFLQVMQDVRHILIVDQHEATAQTIYGSAGRLVPVTVTLASFGVGLLVFRRDAPWFAERV